MPPPNTPDDTDEIMSHEVVDPEDWYPHYVYYGSSPPSAERTLDADMVADPPSSPPSPTRIGGTRNLVVGDDPEPDRPDPMEDLEPYIDWEGLEYIDQVDENLHCAICKTPFYGPVTTPDCQHTFCFDCLRQHIKNLTEENRSLTCPMCRTEISGGMKGVVRADRIVVALLDQLQVKCPERLCRWVGPRLGLEKHVGDICPYTPVPCIQRSCPGKIIRASQSDTCQHYQERCELCSALINKAAEYEHRMTVCPFHAEQCGDCGFLVERQHLSEHSAVCSTTDTGCKYEELGCQHKDMGGVIKQHEETCVYGLVSRLEERLLSKIEATESLRSQNRQMQYDIQEAQERLAKVETEQAALKEGIKNQSNLAAATTTSSTSSSSTSSSSSPLPSSSSHAQAAAAAATVFDDHQERAQYMLETFDQIDKRVLDFSQALVSQDARQTTMLLNETRPLKEQMTDIRSQLGVLGMHVRWLMDVQRTRQRQNIINSFSGTTTSDSGSPSTSNTNNNNDGGLGSGSTSTLVERRLSDRGTPPRPSL